MAFLDGLMQHLAVLQSGSILSHDTNAATAVASNQPAAGGVGSGSFITWIIIWVAVLILLFVIPNRSRKKQEAAMQKMHESIKVGDSVVLSSGLYGKIVDIYPENYVVEFGINKGVRIPVNKGDVISVKEPNLTNIKKEEVKTEESKKEENKKEENKKEN